MAKSFITKLNKELNYSAHRVEQTYQKTTHPHLLPFEKTHINFENTLIRSTIQ